MTQLNCANDYYAYCSEFTVGSKELRLCMRRAGPKLSKVCLDALIADGEVSKAEVAKRKEEIAAAKNPNKQKPTADQKVVEGPRKREPTVLAKEEVARKEPIVATKNPDRQQPKAEQKVVEPLQEQESIVLDEPTFAALKGRAPRFIEEAEAVEAPKFADELKAQDPQKRYVKLTAEPVEADVPKLLREAKAEDPRKQDQQVIDEPKAVDKFKAIKKRKAIGYTKSKTKVVAHKTEKQRGAE